MEKYGASPPTSLPDLEIYPATLSGREVILFKIGASVDLLAPNFSNDFFEKLGASRSTLAPILKSLRNIISLISPLSKKSTLSLLFLDRGDKILKII